LIEFLDLKWQIEHAPEIKDSINRVLKSGNFVGGPEVELFESEFASYTDSIFCTGVGNGLDALRLALLSAGVEPGDEVIVPAYTFIATWLAVTSIGAKVVPVDVNPIDLSINSKLINKKITNKTKCIIPVFIFGKLCVDIDEIIQIAQKNNLMLIFDAAQSAGADYINAINKKNIEKIIMAWSFYPGKNLGAIGDAGAVTTNNKAINDYILFLRNYGSKVKYISREKGFNSRLDSLHAAVLRDKLKYLDLWNQKRGIQAKIYDRICSDFITNMFDSSASHQTNWHLFVTQTSYRDEIIKYLLSKDIQTGIHYPIPPYKQECYRNLNINKSHFKVTSSASKRVLSLPIGPHLNEYDIEKVVDAINNFIPKK
jgi:dTDP-4-amino-4,6-dideoxygalactose transaminase